MTTDLLDSGVLYWHLLGLPLINAESDMGLDDCLATTRSGLKRKTYANQGTCNG